MPTRFKPLPKRPKPAHERLRSPPDVLAVARSEIDALSKALGTIKVHLDHDSAGRAGGPHRSKNGRPDLESSAGSATAAAHYAAADLIVLQRRIDVLIDRLDTFAASGGRRSTF